MNQIVKLDKKKESATVFVDALSHDGRGIGKLENKKVFIAEGLLHETVTCEIVKKKKNYYEAKAIQIKNPSLIRTIPVCKHFGICGGCSLQHMDSDAQIELKQKTLLEQLQHFGNVSPQNILKPLTALTSQYRRKARLGVKFVIKKNKVLVGFRERSKPYLAELATCNILHASVGEELEALGNLIASLQIMQSIPQIEVAIGDSDVALIFRLLKDLPSEDEEKLLAFAKQKQMQIYIQPNSPHKIYKLWPQDGKERLKYTLPEFDLQYEFYPTDFTQINLEMNRLMIRQAVRLLEINNDETILDLFCGIGNFSLPLAKHAKRVIGIEGSQEMVSRAFDNAALNGISNAVFYACNLADPTEITRTLTQAGTIDKILLDPPRAGAIEVIPYLKSFKAKRIVYVSCNPATLARDAGELVQTLGYTLTHVGVLNMFPHTAHVEAMAVFDL